MLRGLSNHQFSKRGPVKVRKTKNILRTLNATHLSDIEIQASVRHHSCVGRYFTKFTTVKIRTLLPKNTELDIVIDF